MLEECTLAGIRFEQEELRLGQGQGERDGGKSTTATDVDHAAGSLPGHREQRTGLGDLGLDLFQRSCAGQVDALVPVEQQLRVALQRRAHNLTIWPCRSTSFPA